MTSVVDERKARARALIAELVDLLIVDERRSAEYSTYQLPPDAKNAASFNKACRRGLVTGARKVGRCWTCTAVAWSEYRMTAQPAPSVAAPLRAVPRIADDVLERLGGKVAS